VRQQRLFPMAAEGEPAGITHELPDSPYIQGAHWGARLQAIMQEPGWSVADVAEWARRWLDAALTETRSPAPQGALPTTVSGALLDATPWNLIAAPGG